MRLRKALLVLGFVLLPGASAPAVGELTGPLRPRGFLPPVPAAAIESPARGGARTAQAPDCVAARCPSPQAVDDARRAVAEACDCAGAPSRRKYRRCARKVLTRAVSSGLLPRRCLGGVRRCEKRSTCGRAGAVVCCGTKRNGMVKSRVVGRAGRCAAPSSETACAAFASATDACAPDGGCRPPNFIVILVDDLGYGDLGAFGATDIRTPSIDRLAREGMRLTDFYAAPSCTPARAALMTGSYGKRVSVPPAYLAAPLSTGGLHPDEITIAELLRTRGYRTGIFGKWHLGDAPEFLPTRQGFEEFFGLPYSNDIGPLNTLFPQLLPDLPLLEGEAVLELNPDQSTLTERFTDHAVDFIDRHADAPFFLYLAHPMPHVPLFVSAPFLGHSGRGLYGDVVEEIDASVGRVLDALAQHRLERRTLVLFASDNGPWLVMGNHGGSAGPLREGKNTTFEGGIRVPAIARWPGRIPAATSTSEPLAVIDVLPTLAALAGVDVPGDRIIDGRSVWSVLSGAPAAESPHDVLYFHHGGELRALRSGRWKLHLPHSSASVAVPGVDGGMGALVPEPVGLELYDLVVDAGETADVAAQHPETVASLLRLAEGGREDLGDTLTGRTGTGVRPPGVRRIEVVLTFDDGPVDAEVPRLDAPLRPFHELLEPLDGILEELVARGAQAVFFAEGPWTQAAALTLEDVHREGLTRIRTRGHLIGYHAFDHSPALWLASAPAASIEADLDRLVSFLARTIGAGAVTPILRPPFGGPGLAGAHARAWAEARGIVHRGFMIDAVDWTSNATADPAFVLPVQCESARLDYVRSRIAAGVARVTEGPGAPAYVDVLFHVNAFTGRHIAVLLDTVEDACARAGYRASFQVPAAYLESSDDTVDLSFLADLGQQGECP